MLNENQILENWDKLLEVIDLLEEPRKTQVKSFYEKNKDFFILCPASTKASYHSAFPGGYVFHVLNVVKAAFRLHKLWEEMGASKSYTNDELLFSALNHDLGKVFFDGEPFYLENDSDWHRKNQCLLYIANTNIPFMEVPDRSLFILQENGIKATFNETLAIKLHDGLYSDANKNYLMGYLPETKLRTTLPYILHQADIVASKIEFEQQWLIKQKKQ